jgi:hypothetical protein
VIVTGTEGLNLYPDPSNFPITSFPQPVPAPDFDPDDAGTLITVQYSWEWQQVLLAAIDQLRNPATWQGDHDTVITALNRATNLKDMLQIQVAGSSEIDTPFWDDSTGDDASAQATPSTESWYGVWDGETFVESMSYWAVTAFLATGISEGAAIQFVTPLRTFRLTLKKNPHGAKLLALMDSNIFQLIDLYSASDEIEEVDIVSPGSTLMLVHSGEHNSSAAPDGDGNYVVQVIKSRLSEDDVLPPNIRYTGDPPIFQTTTDGGTTWVDTPAADPRYNPAGLLPPLTPYSGIECDVAARMTAQLKATLDNFIAAIDAAQFVSEVLALISLPFGWVGWLLDAALFVGNQLIDIGQSNIDSAFTSTIYDDITCIFSCFIKPDGSIDQASLDAAYDTIAAAHTGTVAGVIGKLRLLYGDVAMSNAGVSRDETGDCSGCPDCDWVIEYDFTGGFINDWLVYVDSNYAYGTYDGQAFKGIRLAGSPVELIMFTRKPGIVITGVAVLGDVFHGTGIGHALSIFDITSTGMPPTVTTEAVGGLTTVAADTWTQIYFSTFTTTDGIGWNMTADGNGTGHETIQAVRLAGTGTPPSGGRRVSSLT